MGNDVGAIVVPEELKNKVISRYFKWQHFLNFIKGGFYFSRVDAFDDIMEMAKPADYQNIIYGRGLVPHPHFLEDQKHTYASCWYGSGLENIAMWKLYADAGAMVSINLGELCNRLNQGKDQMAAFPINVSAFQIYEMNYLSEDYDWNNSYYGPFFKDGAYSHEKEIRFELKNNSLTNPNSPDHIEIPITPIISWQNSSIKISLNPFLPRIYYDLYRRDLIDVGLENTFVESKLYQIERFKQNKKA